MNLKKIKDSRNGLIKRLFSLLADGNKVEDSAMCDDIIVAQKESGLSDEDVIKAWDNYANGLPEAKEYQRDFQEFLSENLDQPESLDELTYDYCVHQGIPFDSAVELLNHFLSVNNMVMFCNKLLETTEK